MTIMERLGQLLAGRAGSLHPNTADPELEERVDAVVARVDGLQERADGLQRETADLGVRVERIERRQGDDPS